MGFGLNTVLRKRASLTLSALLLCMVLFLSCYRGLLRCRLAGHPVLCHPLIFLGVPQVSSCCSLAVRARAAGAIVFSCLCCHVVLDVHVVTLVTLVYAPHPSHPHAATL